MPGLYSGSERENCAGSIKLSRPADESIHWHTNTEVIGIDLADRKLFFGQALPFSFDYLVAASGSKAKRIQSSIGCGEHTHTVIHCLDDSIQVGDLSQRPGPVSVVGAGAIGCEFAALLSTQGHAVDLYDVAGRGLLANLLGEEVGQSLQQFYIAQGVNVISGWPQHLECADDPASRPAGPPKAQPLVVEALGYSPQVAWLEGNGLDVNHGVQVDALMQAKQFPRLFAAGDVARYPNPIGDGSSCRRVSWENAVTTGEIAGRSIANCIRPVQSQTRRRTVRKVPVFSTDLFGLRFRACGQRDKPDVMTVSRGDLADLSSGVFIKFFSEAGLSGMLSIAGIRNFEANSMESSSDGNLLR